MFADFQIDIGQVSEAIDTLKRVLNVYNTVTGEKNIRSTFAQHCLGRAYAKQCKILARYLQLYASVGHRRVVLRKESHSDCGNNEGFDRGIFGNGSAGRCNRFSFAGREIIYESLLNRQSSLCRVYADPCVYYGGRIKVL